MISLFYASVDKSHIEAYVVDVVKTYPMTLTNSKIECALSEIQILCDEMPIRMASMAV